MTGVVSAGVDLRYDRAVSSTGAPSPSSGTFPGVTLHALIGATRRLDELSTARVVSEAAEAVHKAQKGGQPLGTLVPQAVVVTTAGISIAPPATASVAYTAPERLRGGAGDRRSDVFALGVMLWEALAHERLFDGATDDARKAAVLEREIHPPSEHNANVPAELDAICKKALDRDPANRYQSAKVMAAEISAVLDDAGYPDSNEQITAYLAIAVPDDAPSPSSSTGAALAAKLAATSASSPATRQQLNMTVHGMAPIREPAKIEPAKLEPSKPMTVGSGLSLTELPKLPPKADPGKTIPAGSGLSVADLPRAVAEAKLEPQSSNLSPKAFSKPAKDPTIASTQPGTGIPTLPPADDYTALAKPMALIVEEVKPKAMIIEKAKPKATIVDEPKPKASISNAETIATPALTATAAPAAKTREPAAAASGIAGLPATPPGAFDDDFATNSGVKPYVEVPVTPPSPPVVAAPVVAPPILPPVNPAAAVALPRPRSASQAGADRASAPDMLADWGWKTDSHGAMVDDGSEYEDDPKSARKRLIYAIGGALGVILLIVVIAVAASGGGKNKDKDKAVEPPIADTSRPAEPRPSESQANAKIADPPATPVPMPAYEATAQPPTPIEPTKAEPVPVEPVKAAAADTAKLEAARIEAQKIDAAKAEAAAKKAATLEAAKAEAARVETARTDAAAQKAAKQETARLAKIEAANAAAAKAADAQRETAEAARLARVAKLEAAKTAKPEPIETAKITPPKEPKKPRDPRTGKLTGRPIDPYVAAPEKTPKTDPAVAYKTGFQQYVRGDTTGALTTFKDSLSASPGYPPTWRGLGLVYEKMGQKAQAKKSFLRYLQLSPKAGDAEQIRTRMEKLGS